MSYYSERDLINTVNIYSCRDANFSAETLNESSQIRRHYDFFLSHSSSDFSLVIGLYKKLTEKGYIVFLDKIETKDISIQSIANKLKEAMNNSTYILYAHTHNSINSKWVPWELGYFDSNKGEDKILVMPIINEYGKAKYAGQEYLTQYKEIEVEDLAYIESTEQKRKKFFEDIIKGAF